MNIAISFISLPSPDTMFTFNSQRHRVLLSIKSITFSLNFCTGTSSAAASYLITTLGISPQSASKASKGVRLNAPEKVESVITFFRNWGFSDSHLRSMISKEPWLLSCDPNKRLLPKFQFLLSKGASSSGIVSIVSRGPRFLNYTLNNRLVPTYELIYSFLKSDEETVACLVKNSASFYSRGTRPNVKLLIDHGVSSENIARLLRKWPSILCSPSLPKLMEEAKKWGFDPSKSNFSTAMLAMHTVNKSRWDEKVEAFKVWGWSHEDFLGAFRRYPNCMLTSSDKINAVFGFWVNQMRWDALALVKGPDVFGFHLEKKLIPRASVLQYLLAKGLRSQHASLITPFRLSEEAFLQKFVNCFEEEDTAQLLKLYKEKMNIQHNIDDGCIRQKTNG